MVLVVTEPKDNGRLRRDARTWGDGIGFGIAAHELEKVYGSAGWMTGLASSQGAEVGRPL
jgi:hypothetical protein